MLETTDKIVIDNNSCLNDYMIERLVDFIIINTSPLCFLRTKNAPAWVLKLSFVDHHRAHDYFIPNGNEHRTVIVWPYKKWSATNFCQMIAHEIAEWIGLSHADMIRCDEIDTTNGRLAGSDGDIDNPEYWDRMFQYKPWAAPPPHPLYWATDFHKLNPCPEKPLRGTEEPI